MKKVLKNNWWNKLFHQKKLSEQHELYRRYKVIYENYDQLLRRLNAAKTLSDILAIHKEAWKLGYRNNNLNVSQFGMFRAKSIEELNLDTLFLGNVYGLWTNPGTFWEENKEEDMSANGFGIDPNIKCYDIICRQYRNCLRNNFSSIEDEVSPFINEYEYINGDEDFVLYKYSFGAMPIGVKLDTGTIGGTVTTINNR